MRTCAVARGTRGTGEAWYVHHQLAACLGELQTQLEELVERVPVAVAHTHAGQPRAHEPCGNARRALSLQPSRAGFSLSRASRHGCHVRVVFRGGQPFLLRKQLRWVGAPRVRLRQRIRLVKVPVEATPRRFRWHATGCSVGSVGGVAVLSLAVRGLAVLGLARRCARGLRIVTVGWRCPRHAATVQPRGVSCEQRQRLGGLHHVLPALPLFHSTQRRHVRSAVGLLRQRKVVA